jgi:hypothetical protein
VATTTSGAAQEKQEETGDEGRRGAPGAMSGAEQKEGVACGTRDGCERSLFSGRENQGSTVRVAEVGRRGAQTTESEGSQAAISWAAVVAGREVVQTGAQRVAGIMPVVVAGKAGRGEQGVGDAGAADALGSSLVLAATAEVGTGVERLSAQGSRSIREGQPEQRRVNGIGQNVEVVGIGELPLDLPDEVLFEVLARVPITELRRLLSRGSAAGLPLPSETCSWRWPARR